MRHLLLLLLVGSVFASGEFKWADDGVPVRQGVHIEWQRSGDVGAAGEMIMAWSDTRIGDRDVYMQKIDTLGTKLWGETGIRATVALGRQEDPVMVSDGLGGAFLAWIDYRDDEYGDVYAQHVDASGNLSWDPAGVPIAVNSGSQQTANMARGAEGVAYLIWDDGSLSESGDIFGTVLTLSGPLAAGGTNGIPVVSAAGSQTNHSIETSGSEAVIVWRDLRDNDDPNIYGQRVDVNFNGLWGENGIVVCDAVDNQFYPKVAPADGNRVAVSWLDKRSHIKGDLFAQLLDENGAPVWAANGIAITDLDAEQKGSRVKSNGVDRIYFVWEDFRNNPLDQDIYMQSVDLAGNPQWSVDGIPVSLETLKQHQPRFTLGEHGGVYVTWLDERNGGYPESDMYIQYVRPDGSMAYAANGMSLTNGLKYQEGGLVRSDGFGGAITIWSNGSTGSIGITGQHIGVSGSQGWDVDGMEFFFGIDGDASKAQLLPWQENKVLIFWEDMRWSGTGAVAMAQAMDRNASITHTMDGVAVSGNEEQKNPRIVADNVGGAFVTYTNISSGSEVLFAQHIDTNLEPTWPADGIQVNPNAFLGQEGPRMVTGSDGYLYYFWTENIFLQGLFVYAQKFDIDGNPQWDVGGVLLDFGAVQGDMYAIEPLALVEGGIVLVWRAETLDGTKTFVSKIGEDGTIAWTEALSEVSTEQIGARAIYDPAASLVYIGWVDQRNLASSGADLYWVSVDGNGNFSEEQLISDAFGDQTGLDLALADDGSGVLYAAWQDFDGFQHDIYVKNLTTDTAPEQVTTLETDNKAPAIRAVNGSRYLVAWEDGRPGIYTDVYFYDSQANAPGHADNGVAVSMALLNQMQPQIMPFADNAPDSLCYLIAWQDMRSSGKTELTNIYAQAYTGQWPASVDEPILAEAFKLEAAFPNPFNGAVTIPFKNPQGRELTLRIHDIRGAEVMHVDLGSAPEGSYTWNGSSRSGMSLSSGVYILRLEGDALRHSQKIMYLK